MATSNLTCRVLVCLALAPAAAGCTLTSFGDDACETSEQCRAAFGFGFACNADGLCDPAPDNLRCQESEPIDLFDRPENYGDSIVLGSILDSTDGSDQSSENALRLAITRVNEAEGVNGRSFAVVFCDNRQDLTLDELDSAQASAAIAEYLARDLGVPAILGPGTSTTAREAYLAASPYGTLTMSHSATSPALTELDPPSIGLFWRTAPPDSVQGAAIADDMQTRMVDNVAVIHEEGPYGAGLATVFQQEFVGGGLTATVSEFPAGNDSVRDDLTLTAGADATVDEVLFISSVITDVVAFAGFAQAQSGFVDKEIFVTDTAATTQFVDDAAPTAGMLFDQIRGTRPTLPSGLEYMAFEGAYSGAFPAGPPVASFPYAAFSYDAAWLVFYGAAWAEIVHGRVTGSTIADGLRHLSSGERLPVSLSSSWATALAAFATETSVDLAGASGSLDFDPVTEETATPIEVWRIMGIDASATIVLDHVYEP